MFNLTLRQLSAIRTIARTGRINESASQLGLTAPAVTLQLRQVEAGLGTILFQRTRDGMQPTEAGKVVIAAADDIHDRLSALTDEVTALVAGRRGRVRLGAVSTAKYFAPAMIAAFRQQHPGIDVRLLVGNRAETVERLRHRELDLVIMGRPPRDIPVEMTAMGDHPFVIVAAPDHPLAKARAISRARIAQETFLLREAGSGTRRSLELYFVDFPEKYDNPGVEMGSNESIKQAVMAGLGVALLSAHTVAAEVGQGWLAVLDADGMPVMRQWYCVAPASRPLGASARALRDFLTNEAPALLPQVRVAAGPAAEG